MAVNDVNSAADATRDVAFWTARAGAANISASNFVDGRPAAATGEAAIRKFSPRDGAELYEFQSSSRADVDGAVSIGAAAYLDGRWSGLSPQSRKEILLNFAAAIESNRDELALLDSLDVGKPISDALNVDVPLAAGIIRHNAELADKITGAVFSASHRSLSYQLERPLGLVAAIVGWNFPLALAASKLGPALAAGNSLLLKPSEVTSLSARRLAEIASEAGVPDGVFNVVVGDANVGAMMAGHHDIDMLTFTGSTATGKKLLIAAGSSNMKRVMLECGGKAANIVFEDCPDLDEVAASIAMRAFWNAGQVCTASSRLLVQAGLKDDLLSRIVSRMRGLKVGDPLDPGTRFGAVVSAEHRQKIEGYIRQGIEQGAKFISGGDFETPFENGFYVAPVILDGVRPDTTVAREEIFGPVLSVLTFRDEADALRIANGTIYGLSAIVWTRDLGRAQRMAYGLDVGWTTIQASSVAEGGPGPGALEVCAHKQSGVGTEGGLGGLRNYLAKTAIQVFT